MIYTVYSLPKIKYISKSSYLQMQHARTNLTVFVNLASTFELLLTIFDVMYVHCSMLIWGGGGIKSVHPIK